MSEFNKSYRIRTEVGKDTQLHVKLDQKYDVLELMSLKINQENAYRLHTSNYGVIAGRVLANGAFGIPNAKISVFINIDDTDINDVVKSVLYPYNTTSSKDKNDVRYNLLPNEQLTDCHTIIGTFPEKQYALDNDSVLEIFEKYYKYTTRTNEAGDYMIFGVPVGSQTIHVDIDLSDIGILSQKPRDMVYKGYDINQFENPNKFKYDTNLNSLTQVISQDNVADVIPFWGDETEGTIGITRCDIDVQYKFEPTCVFMGSVVSDTASNGISKKCVPSPGMGAMDEITTGSGTIEMIRKKPDGSVEEFQIQGTQLINGDGVWCYQIPMNLDYMMTDEFGNMVPTNDPNKGIPTRTRVRFRISMQDFDSDSVNMFRGKMLVPHNPKTDNDIDYQFGSNTAEESFKDLFWNGVYSVKSYIPRIQKGTNWRNEKFTGFKRVNYYGDKNPIPYNNIRIKIPFMYTILCTLIKFFFKLSGIFNLFIRLMALLTGDKRNGITYVTLDGTLCDENLENVCIIPGIQTSNDDDIKESPVLTGIMVRTIVNFIYTINGVTNGLDVESNNIDGRNTRDENSIDYINKTNLADKYINSDVPEAYVGTGNGEKAICFKGIRITNDIQYLTQCIEMNLAQEYRVIQFDFYNDWINGLIYIPRWARNITKKYTFIFPSWTWGGKVKACNENYYSYSNRNIVQQCGLTYSKTNNTVLNDLGCKSNKKLRCHKSTNVRLAKRIFRNGGLVQSFQNLKNQYIYYFKPIEANNSKNIRLYSTDIILLGTLNNCDKWGVPNTLQELVSSSYQMPTNLALTDSDMEGREFTSTTKNKNGYGRNYDDGNIWAESLAKGGEKLQYLEYGGLHDKGIDILSENGNYTELSGIDWGYEGPLQKADEKIGTDIPDFFKPGGHFLGLSCRNSETTIKTCVNLSRICEFGVWMSQRQELNIPNSNASDTWESMVDYATVPSGLISKDEISDTPFRSVFATLNSNNLKTVINTETGYPIYDFKFLYPTNFGGELLSWVTRNQNYNRKISDSVDVTEWDYKDDDYYIRSKGIYETTPEVQIMRTGEYKDKEYYKFRFGLTEEDYNNQSKKEKKYLFNTSSGYSFPMYENSFYFYFGLHDGKTAVDEFKKQYYAVCEKNTNLTQANQKIVLSNIQIEYDGICPDEPDGKLHFYVKADESAFNFFDAMEVGLYKTDGTLVDSKKVEMQIEKVKFNNIPAGVYNIIVSSNVLDIREIFPVEIGKITIEANASAVKFKKDVSGIDSPEQKFALERLDYGGYICLKENLFTYKKGIEIEEEDNVEDTEGTSNLDYVQENVFTSKYVKRIVVECKNKSVIYQTDTNSLTTFIFNGVSVPAQTNENGEYMIPVPYEDETYSVYIDTYIGTSCKPKKYALTKTHFYRWHVGDVTINNNTNILDFTYNKMSYNNIVKTHTENIDNWWENPIEDEKHIQWSFKESLYLTDLNKPHKITITNTGGQAPYTESVTGMKEDINYSTSGVTRADFEIVKIPTINYRNKDGKKRDNFTYQVEDIDKQICPESPFVFPVIYKPFFMEMGMWYFDELKKYYLIGNVYNGKTWDYETEGFNKVELNSVAVANLTTVEKDDTTMELDEPTLSPDKKGGYSYSGPYFKYNGRKTTVSREIEPITYGLTTTKEINSMNLSIGSSHTDDNGVVFEDYVKVAKTKMQFFEFSVSGRTYEGKYYIKITPNVSGGTTQLLLNDETDGYTYPIVNSLPNVSDKLHRAVIDGNIQKYELTTETIDGIPGYIDVSNKSNTGSVYYIAIPQNEEIFSSSNSENKFNSVSVSTLINLNSLAKFYPLYIDAEIKEIINGDAYDAQLTIYPSNTLDGSADNFKNKRFEIVFYNKMNALRIEYLTVNIIVGEDSSKTVNLTQNEILQLGLTGVGTKGLKYYYNVYHIENGTYEKAPTSYLYNKLGKELTMNTKVIDNTPAPKIINVDINGNITSDSEVQALPCDLEIMFYVEEEGGDPAISKGFTQTFSKGVTNLLRKLPSTFEDDRIITINPDEYTFTHENQRYKIIWEEITLTPTNT